MSEDRPKSSPTIVGGQPAGKRDSREGSPRNIEKIVLDLASDESFRGSFLKDRRSALADAQIVLSPDEEKVLGSISDGELLAMAGVLAPTEEPSRRRFLRAAASLAALSGVGALSCDNRKHIPEGIQPDMPTPTALPNGAPTQKDQLSTPPVLIPKMETKTGISSVWSDEEELSERTREVLRQVRESSTSPPSATDTSSRKGGETDGQKAE